MSDLVQELQDMHSLTPLPTVAMGQGVISALLLASGRQTELERFQLEVKGKGPLGGVTAIADGTGRVRGYCGNPQVCTVLCWRRPGWGGWEDCLGIQSVCVSSVSSVSGVAIGPPLAELSSRIGYGLWSFGAAICGTARFEQELFCLSRS